MREVFVDTSGWVALKHKGDTFWQAATTLHRALLTAGARYVTSNFVLDESYTLLLHRAGHHVGITSLSNSGKKSVRAAWSRLSVLRRTGKRKPGRCSSGTPTKPSVSQIARRLS